ncbi:hypothetical protein KGA66_12385 [Actinocrinis puniceicyclus]|uniref:Uncharacterized protein n=1 Tax=Actinocrinis puniceicyclus TaxID=977794 RepID=A0A8J8BC76_9ACTN|nr:hypothetical protein [Actinocrinis puniceicyclus]MBS2963848.1 hypothetical protein [Actinocrinis puniceicyclus]
MSEVPAAGASGTRAPGTGAAGLAPTTVMELPVPPPLVSAYAGNLSVPRIFEAHRAAGFCVRAGDIASGDAAAVRAQHGLTGDPAWTPQHNSADAFHVLRFYASWPGAFVVPFGGSTPEGAERMGTSRVYPEPFLGTGYTAFAPRAVPQYWLPLTELPLGTELWRIGADGSQQPVAAYLGRYTGWQPQPGVEPFGPQPWQSTPQALRTAVRRGLRAVYQGGDFDADFGPEPGRITLYRSGTAGEAVQSRAVLDAHCDAVRYVRLLCTWHGARFEAIDAAPDSVTLNYLGENHLEAGSLGLTEVGYRVWRTTVPRAEVSEYAEETLEVGVQAHFG